MKVQIPFVLAPHQAIVRNCRKRHRVMACGRRTGKTLGAVYMTVEFLTTHPDAIGWWVAPTFTLTRKGMRETIRFLRGGQRQLVAGINRTERRIEFANGSFLEFRSAHDPDEQLVSEGLDWLVVDEAALIDNANVWPQYLRPALSDRLGRALLISSPRGQNWFHDAFLDGQRAESEEWASWNISTAEAGFVDLAELARIEKDTPQRIWEQEYCAKFLEGEGAVFRKVDAAIAPASERREYVVLGVDLARVRDWTVIWAVNDLGEWIEWDRFQNLDWSVQKPRIVAMYKRLGAKRVLLDTTGMHVGADAVANDLRREGLAVETVTLDGSTKRAIVENAMVRFDSGAVTVAGDPIVLSEFKRYTYTPLPSGRERYSAPEGEHDDVVMAACLAWWGIRQFAGKNVRPVRESELQRMRREVLERINRPQAEDAWGI